MSYTDDRSIAWALGRVPEPASRLSIKSSEADAAIARLFAFLFEKGPRHRRALSGLRVWRSLSLAGVKRGVYPRSLLRSSGAAALDLLSTLDRPPARLPHRAVGPISGGDARNIPNGSSIDQGEADSPPPRRPAGSNLFRRGSPLG